MKITRNQLALIGTGIWLLVATVLAWSRLDTLSTMTLNEWGDFFAGVVAPLAFLWLILGYLQQGEEVRSNTETLQLQQRALQQQVEGTAALVRNAEQQTKAALARLELEQSKWERRLADERARIQPRFAFAGGEGQGGANFILRYTNKGGRATHLTVVNVTPFCEISFSPQEVVEAGASGAINASRMTSYPTKLTIAYMDQNNEEGRMQVEIYQPGLVRVV